jgi:predicted transcriptional regulator
MKLARFGMVLLSICLAMTMIPAFLIAAEEVEPSYSTRVSDNAEAYVLLDLDDEVQEISPGESIIFEIVARNTGNSTITYYPPSVTSLSVPADWSISFSPASELIIAPNYYGLLNVTLTAPADAKANTIIQQKIIGTTSNPNAEIFPTTITANVHEIYDISLNSVSRITLESPLTTENFKVTIVNDGNVDDHVELRLTGIPEGLELSMESHEFIISSGKTDSLAITLYPSSILLAGEYELNISLYRVTATGKEWVSSRSLWVDVKYYPDLTISSGDIELSRYIPYTGEDISINVTVHNIGDSDARDIIVRITPVTRSGSPLLDIDDIIIPFLEINGSVTERISWRADPAVNKILVTLDPDNTIGELNDKNNKAELPLFISQRETTPEPTASTAGKYTIGQVSAITVMGILTTVTILSAAFFISTENGKYAAFKLIFPLYTRVKKEEVLNHEVRELVYDYVQTHPGEHFRAILTKLGLTNGTLIHHLQTLERQEFIKSERDGPFKRFYPTGRQFTEDVLEINGIQKKILDEVTAHPGLTQKDLAIHLQTSPPTINYHIKALRGVRLINIKRDGKNTRCFPGQSLNGWYKGGVS